MKVFGRALSACSFLVTMGVATACGGVGVSQSPPSLHSSASPQLTYAVPSGYTVPSSLAASPSGTGVWFIAGSDTDTAIFYVSPLPSEDRTYNLGRTFPIGEYTAIAVAPDRSVWAGVNMTLVHLYPATGKVTMYDVPSPQDNAAAESYRPPSVQGAHYITALSVNPVGAVALAISASAQVTLFEHGVFSAWPLPANTGPVDVAYLPDGTLGINLANYASHHTDEVATFTATGDRTLSATVSAPHLVARGSSFVSVSSVQTTLDRRANVTSATPLHLSGAQAQPVTAVQPTVLQTGTVVIPSTDGILLTLPTGGTTDVAFPAVPCFSRSGSLPPHVQPPLSSAVCHESPVVVAADAADNVWMLLPDHADQIAFVAANGL